ncbi:hypothetical protein BDR03DRAFT_971047 [Suillus americanus]|nr:hypothetical protein BDR03DRAFT_971047 [Suillus americanus]
MSRHISMVVVILSGTHQCNPYFEGDHIYLCTIYSTLLTIWEILVLCLASWITVKHFRELRQHPTGGIIGDCFRILMGYHSVYFVSFTVVFCLMLGYLSPVVSKVPYSMGAQIYLGVLQIFMVVQFFVLGPRLILSVREYHAKLVTNSDAATDMASIAFQECVHVTTSSNV